MLLPNHLLSISAFVGTQYKIIFHILQIAQRPGDDLLQQKHYGERGHLHYSAMHTVMRRRPVSAVSAVSDRGRPARSARQLHGAHAQGRPEANLPQHGCVRRRDRSGRHVAQKYTPRNVVSEKVRS